MDPLHARRARERIRPRDRGAAVSPGKVAMTDIVQRSPRAGEAAARPDETGAKADPMELSPALIAHDS